MIEVRVFSNQSGELTNLSELNIEQKQVGGGNGGQRS